MSARRLLWKIALVLAFLTLMGGMLSCGEEVPSVPRAWIDFPRDGSTITAGSPVSVISHAYAHEGVAEVLLSVNGEAYRRDPPTQPGASFSDTTQEWLPEKEGLYTLRVTTYDTAGETSSQASISIRVVSALAAAQTETPVPPEDAAPPLTDTPPTPTDTATPANLPGPPTNTATPTHTPEAPPDTPTATYTPSPPTRTPTPSYTPRPPTHTPTSTHTPRPPTRTPTPTFTPWTPVQVDFRADRTSLIAGECTTLHWDVEYATAVFLNGSGVIGHGSQQVCPATTTTYDLHVEAPSGNVDPSVTIEVTAPSDTTPPPIPSLAVPADGLEIDCKSSQTLAWMPVSDPSGPVVYDINLERQVSPGKWQEVRGWGPVNGKQIEAKVDCGLYYRWTVRAQDGAGNDSGWSPYSYFSIRLP